MYFRILKKDLHRKKAMNIIVLLFIILATLFVSSSMNNIITVVNTLNSFFERAGIRDYFVAAMGKVITDNIFMAEISVMSAQMIPKNWKNSSACGTAISFS